jgi:hypothetical protein
MIPDKGLEALWEIVKEHDVRLPAQAGIASWLQSIMRMRLRTRRWLPQHWDDHLFMEDRGAAWIRASDRAQ